MIKRLLNNFFKSFTFDHDRKKIEKYLSQSSNTYDLEGRIRDLDKKGMAEIGTPPTPVAVIFLSSNIAGF